MVADNLMATTPIVTDMAADTHSSQCLLLVIHLTNIWEAIYGIWAFCPILLGRFIPRSGEDSVNRLLKVLIL